MKIENQVLDKPKESLEKKAKIGAVFSIVSAVFAICLAGSLLFFDFVTYIRWDDVVAKNPTADVEMIKSIFISQYGYNPTSLREISLLICVFAPVAFAQIIYSAIYFIRESESHKRISIIFGYALTPFFGFVGAIMLTTSHKQISVQETELQEQTIELQMARSKANSEQIIKAMGEAASYDDAFENSVKPEQQVKVPRRETTQISKTETKPKITKASKPTSQKAATNKPAAKASAAKTTPKPKTASTAKPKAKTTK